MKCNVFYIMCEVCCKEFKGWFKSFTKTEIYLSLLEVFFLIVLIAFLIFLILHFLACAKNDFEIVMTPGNLKNITTLPPITITSVVPTMEPTQLSTQPSTLSTLGKDIECTWTPSKKTDAASNYYERAHDMTAPSSNVNDRFDLIYEKSSSQSFRSDSRKRVVDSNSDVDIVDNVRKSFLLALVKIRHPQDILFGCTLTVISIHWTLSAASCIEAIEEVDALDSFVIMERFGETSQGETRELSDVIIHPEYRGVNKNYDLVAIKSEDVLVKDDSPTITLPTLLDNSLITLGERLGVLGFGKFSTEADHLDRRVREVSVYKLVRSQCRGADMWAARHLVGGHAAGRGAGGPSLLLCAARAEVEAGAACPCGGAPLMRARTLLGVLSDDGACGLACRPAIYVDVALHRDWLDSVLQGD